jgi:hypothetical protein
MSLPSEWFGRGEKTVPRPTDERMPRRTHHEPFHTTSFASSIACDDCKRKPGVMLTAKSAQHTPQMTEQYLGVSAGGVVESEEESQEGSKGERRL